MRITLRALKRVNKQNNPLNLSTLFGTFLCSHRKNNVVKFDRNGIAIVAFISVRSSLRQ